MDKKSYKDMWVYIEHDGTAVHPVALELCCEVRKLCRVEGSAINEAKRVLAFTLTEQVHGTEEAIKAREAAECTL